PFEPAVHGGELWARGAADNKGNHMACVKAAEHLHAAGGLPINVRFVIEGEEEITGPSLPRYLRAHGADLKTDTVLIWDSGMDEDGRPTLATALRGLLYTELRAKGPAVDLHSGTFGGVAPNPINTLARVIGELKDWHGHVTIPAFYDAVRPPGAGERADHAGRRDQRRGDRLGAPRHVRRRSQCGARPAGRVQGGVRQRDGADQGRRLDSRGGRFSRGGRRAPGDQRHHAGGLGDPL